MEVVSSNKTLNNLYLYANSIGLRRCFVNDKKHFTLPLACKSSQAVFVIYRNRHSNLVLLVIG